MAAFTPIEGDEQGANGSGGGDFEKETMIIPDGPQLCRFAGYTELGKHVTSHKGEKKDPAFMIALTFEFSDAEYTGGYPLCIDFTKRNAKGVFWDTVHVTDKLFNNELSPEYANGTRYMRVLNAMRKALGDHRWNIAEYVGEVFMAEIEHNITDEGTNKEKTYANMDIFNLSAPEHTPPKGETEYYEMDNEQIGEYALFEWEEPTAEEWILVKPWHKEIIKDAIDFPASPIFDLLVADPDLDKADEPEEDEEKVNTKAKKKAKPGKKGKVKAAKIEEEEEKLEEDPEEYHAEDEEENEDEWEEEPEEEEKPKPKPKKQLVAKQKNVKEAKKSPTKKKVVKKPTGKKVVKKKGKLKG